MNGGDGTTRGDATPPTGIARWFGLDNQRGATTTRVAEDDTFGSNCSRVGDFRSKAANSDFTATVVRSPADVDTATAEAAGANIDASKPKAATVATDRTQ